jgi:hypothetical protein
LIDDRDEDLNELVRLHLAIIVLLHSVVEENVALVLVIVRIFDAKVLLSLAASALIYIQS